MNYTLYIDESGDFESGRGEWVVAGLLVPLKFDICEKILHEAFQPLPRQLGCASIRDFHLTEFRTQFGHLKATEMAKATLNTLAGAIPSHTCLATINFSKTSVVERERTYRLMLSDLLAMCETALPENDQLDSLDILVASRTIDGTIQTSISHITNEVLKALPEAFEVGLATRGIIGLLGNKISVRMDYANNSWGLVCADFIANLTYHQKRRAADDELLSHLEQTGKYLQFESFGNYELRQAKVAERDHDYVSALYRWLLQSLKNDEGGEASTAICRVLRRVFANQTSVQPHATVEAVLERLWRTHRTPDKFTALAAMLKLFEKTLEEVITEKSLQRFAYLIFRTRNMILMVDNHRGDTQSADMYTGKQKVLAQELVANPELFHLVLDFKAHEIETLINRMELESALSIAQKYYELIQSYKTVWELLSEHSDAIFSRSKTSIKAEMGLLRCQLLCIGCSAPDNSTLANMPAWFEALEQVVASPSDISRLNNYRVLYFLKSGKPQKAVTHCLAFHKDINAALLNEFDLFWFLRAVNDCLLCATLMPKQASPVSDVHAWDYVVKCVDFQIRNAKIEGPGHPRDLIWREIALFEHHRNNKSKAAKAIGKSRKYFTAGNSPILEHISKMLDEHDSYINDKTPSSDLKKYSYKKQYLCELRCSSPY